MGYWLLAFFHGDGKLGNILWIGFNRWGFCSEDKALRHPVSHFLYPLVRENWGDRQFACVWDGFEGTFIFYAL